MSREREPMTRDPGQQPGADSNAAGRYTVRQFRPADRSGVLDVLESASGDLSPSTWFSWAVVENPFVDHVPLAVATCRGRVVAVRAATAIPLLAGEATVLALQPRPLVARPGHRDTGLSDRTVSLLADLGGTRQPGLLFDFRNGGTRDDDPEGEWDVVGTVPRYYRLQRPGSMFSTASPVLETLADLASPVVRSGLAAADRLANPSDEFDVTCHADLPVDALVSLYRREIPDGFHAVRNPEYLGWRYRHPAESYRAYTASRDGTPEAAVVVGRRETDGRDVASLTDVYPVTGNEQRVPALAALLARVVRDVADADVVTVQGNTLPPSLLGRFGFVSAGAPFLPADVGRPTVRTRRFGRRARPSGSVVGREPTDRYNWSLSGTEQLPR